MLKRTARKIANGLALWQRDRCAPQLAPNFRLLNALIEWKIDAELYRREVEKGAMSAGQLAEGPTQGTRIPE